MTNPTPHGQVPEALRLAHIFDNPLPPEWPDMVAAAAELRRQHTRIAELEAQIEALSGMQALSAAPAGFVPVAAFDRLHAHAESLAARLLAASPTPPAEQAATKAAPVTQQAGYAEVIECGNSYAKVKLKGEAFGSARVGDIFYTALQQDEPVGEVVSASCDHATVRWLHQTSSVGGGDPRNSRAWPKVSGVSRDEGHSRALLVFFAAEPTDDEVRAVHDTLAAAPTAQAAPQPAPAPLSVQDEDAAMYRWLRAQHEDDSGELRCCVYAPNDMLECLVPVGDMPGELDAFIRAALAAQGGK